MTASQPYTYVLLRYRHDPAAGEFINVGVVLHSVRGPFLRARVRKTVGRLSKIFPINKADLTSALDAIERGIRNSADHLTKQDLLTSLDRRDAASWAKAALPIDDSSYIWGPVRSGITSDPASTLDKLYERFIAKYDEEARASRDDADVWAPVRDQLSAKHLLDRLQPKVITSALDEVKFEGAWKNGAWHCYQPLSFDLASPDNIREKAARWSGHMLGVSKASEDVKPYFIVGAPTNPDLIRHYQRAIELLKASEGNPQIFEESEAGILVRQIEAEIKASDLAANRA